MCVRIRKDTYTQVCAYPNFDSRLRWQYPQVYSGLTRACLCMHVCVYLHMNIYVDVHNIYTHTHTHTHTYVHTHAHTHTHIHTYEFIVHNSTHIHTSRTHEGRYEEMSFMSCVCVCICKYVFYTWGVSTSTYAVSQTYLWDIVLKRVFTVPTDNFSAVSEESLGNESVMSPWYESSRFGTGSEKGRACSHVGACSCIMHAWNGIQAHRKHLHILPFIL